MAVKQIITRLIYGVDDEVLIALQEYAANGQQGGLIRVALYRYFELPLPADLQSYATGAPPAIQMVQQQAVQVQVAVNMQETDELRQQVQALRGLIEQLQKQIDDLRARPVERRAIETGTPQDRTADVNDPRMERAKRLLLGISFERELK